MARRTGHRRRARRPQHSTFVRLVLFLSHEPNNPDLTAALARFYLDLPEVDAALGLLGVPPDEDALQSSPFYCSVCVEATLRSGEMDSATSLFSACKPTDQSYDYWRLAGLLRQEALGDFGGAADAYRNAAQTPTGKSDPGIWHRLVECLARSGSTSEADALRPHAERVKDIVDAVALAELTRIVRESEHPDELGTIAEFYRTLDLQREAQAWDEVIRELDPSVQTTAQPPRLPAIPPWRFDSSF
jgi:hypothetical protein